MHLLEKMATKSEKLGINFDFNLMIESGFYFTEDWSVSVQKFSQHYFLDLRGDVPVSIQDEFEEVIRTHLQRNNTSVVSIWGDETKKIKKVISNLKEKEIKAMQVFSMLNKHFDFSYDFSKVMLYSSILSEELELFIENTLSTLDIRFQYSTHITKKGLNDSEQIDKISSFFIKREELIAEEVKRVREMVHSLPHIQIEIKYSLRYGSFYYSISDPSIQLFQNVANMFLYEVKKYTDLFLHKHKTLYQFYEVCSEEDPYFCIINDPPPSMAEHYVFLFQTYFSFNTHDFLEKEFFDGEDAKEVLRRKVKGIKLKSVLKEKTLPERLFPFIYSVCGWSMENIKQIVCEEEIQEDIFQKTVVLQKKEQTFLQVEKNRYKDLYEHYTFSVEGDTLWIKKKE